MLPCLARWCTARQCRAPAPSGRMAHVGAGPCKIVVLCALRTDASACIIHTVGNRLPIASMSNVIALVIDMRHQANILLGERYLCSTSVPHRSWFFASACDVLCVACGARALSARSLRSTYWRHERRQQRGCSSTDSLFRRENEPLKQYVSAQNDSHMRATRGRTRIDCERKQQFAWVTARRA
jgi:hypothetical protein